MDFRYRYAMDLQYHNAGSLSTRTLTRFRAEVYRYQQETGIDLIANTMKQLTASFAKIMHLPDDMKRMDSMMIEANCKSMSRPRIIYSVTKKAVKLLHHTGQDEMIPSNLLHYLNADDLNQVIYHCKSEDASDRLQRAVDEAIQVRDIMSNEIWHSYDEYQLLIRVISEQMDPDGSGKYVPRPKEKIR